MMDARQRVCTALLPFALALSFAATAGPGVDGAGVHLPDSVVPGGQPPVLNGAGLRSKSFFKVCVIGLCLPHKEHRAGAAVTMPGAKRVHMVPMRDVAGRDLADGLLAKIRAVPTAGKGATVALEFEPAADTCLGLDGQVVAAEVPGKDLFQMLLRVWLGSAVTSEALRADLLGLNRG